MSRLLGDDWTLPHIDARTHAWFTTGALMVQRCEDCDAWQHPPEEVCGQCQGTRLGFRACGEMGRIESFVVIHRAVHPKLEAHVPYAVALVSLEGAPGVHVLGNVPNRAPESLAIGQAVRAVFETPESAEGETLKIPQWEVIES